MQIWTYQGFHIDENGICVPLTRTRTQLRFEFLPHDPQKDLGAVAVQVVPGQGINPQPLWMRYCDLPPSLQQIVNDAIRSGGAEQLLLEIVVNCSDGIIFQIIGIIYGDRGIRLFSAEEEARLSE